MNDCRTLSKHAPSCDAHHVRCYDMPAAEGTQCVWVFPREPQWWRDKDAEQQRQSVFENYEPSDLSLLVDEIGMYVRTPPSNDEECAQLIRRLLSLSWIVDVARGATARDEGSNLDQYVSYWQQRAARYLMDAAWNVVLSLPAQVVGRGVEQAVVSEREYHGVDE